MNEFQKILLGAGVDPYKKEREAQQPRQEESKGLLAGLGNMQEKFAGYEAGDADKSAGEQVIQKWMDESKDSYVNQAALNAATGAMNVAAGISSAFGNDTLSDAVEKYQQMQPRRPEFDYTGSEYWTSPQGAWADLWQGLGSSVPMFGAGALVPEAAAVRGAGLLGRGFGRVGLGRVASSNAGSEILKDIVRGVPGAFIDSGSEYGSVAHDLRQQGDDNAAINALPVLGANLALNLFTTPVEYALMKGAGSRVFSPKAGESIGKRAGMAIPRAIPGIAASAAIEGPQELIQETISGAAKGEQVGNPLNPYSWTPEQLQSFVAGAVGGAGMAAPGNIVGGLRSPGEIIEESIRDNAPAADSGNVNTGLKTPEEIIRDSMSTQEIQEDETGTSQGVPSSASAQPTIQTNGNEYQAAIVQAAQQYNIPTDIALGMAARETGGDDINAIHMADNGGLMQITEESARDYGINEKYPNWRTDPKQNALAGMDILSQKIKENNGDVWAGVRAYNGAGPQADAYLEQVRQNAQNLDGMHDTNTGFSTYNLPTQGADIDEQITRLTPELRAALPAIGGILNDMGLAEGSAISSAARSVEHNAEVGGAEGSYHIDSGNGGNAVDIVLPDGTSQEQAEAVAERFRQTGAFEEVLFHDAGSGYHLHLGGYKGGLNGRAINTGTNTATSFQDDLQKFEDAEIPDFASSMKNTTTNAEEYDLFDNMFTSDRKGRDKFVNTPENRRMIRERYQDALEEAALRRMANDVLERPAGRLDSTAATNLSNAVKTGDAGAIRKILTNMYDVNNRNLTQAEARQGRDLPVEQMSQRIRNYLDNTTLEDIGEERYNSLYNALRSGDDTALREAYQAIQSRQGGITNAGTGTSINTARPAKGIQNQNGSAVPQGGEGAAEQGQAIAGQGSQTADILSRNRQAISQRPTGITETMRADDPNVQFTGQYRLVSADDLTTSDSAGYPQQYQPRNRNRAAMRAQVANMANNLNPSAVVDATGNVNLGAPVIDESGVVLNGNGRTMAIRQAYQRNGQSAQAYKQYLKAHADAFGMTPDMIDSIENPVLVRQVGGDAPITDIIHSTAGGADMSAGEQAKSDAEKIKKTTLDLYNEESQSLTSAGNREFVKAVLRDISTGRDANRKYTENGQFSSDAIRRVQNAIFAKAYGDDHLLNQLSESNDNNIRNIINAMLKAAPTVAKINHGIQQKEYYSYPISQVISDAAKTITSLREQGKEVQFYLNETSLFGESFRNPSSVKDVVAFFDQNKRNSRKIYEFINRLCERVIGQGNPRQQSLLPAPRPKLNEIISQTIGEMNNGLRSLFEPGRADTVAETGEDVGRMADGVLQGAAGNSGTVQEAGRRNGAEEARSAEQVTAVQESAPSEPITNRPTVKESEVEVSDDKAGDIEALRQALARKGEAVFNVEDYEKALQEQGDSYTVSDYAKDWMKQKFPNVARDNEAYREIERLVAEQMQAAIAQESQGAASTRAALDWVLNEDKAPMSVVEAYKAHVEAVLNDVERGNMSAQEAQTEIRDSFRGVRKSSSWDTIQGMDFMYNQVLTASEKAHKELQGRIASQSAEIKKAADEGDTVNEENKKDALVSQEPESSNEALGTPAVNASLSTANVAQTQGEVNETTASSKGNAQDVNDIRDSFALRVLYAADPSQRGGYGLKWKKKKANNLLQKYDLGPYEADGKYYVKLTSKDTSAVDLPDIEVPKSEYDYVMNLTGKNEGGNSNAIADSAGAVAARPSERTHQNELGETAESGRPGRSDGQGVSSSDERRTQPVGDVGVSGRGPAAGGTAGDSRVQTQESNDNARSTGSPKLSGGIRAGLEGVPADEQRRPADIVEAAADRRADEANRIIEEQQQKAKDAKRIAEIRKEVPVLLPEQADDVLFAEKRLLDNDKNGVLFTNGTGTGKTFSGMGIVKRMYDRGKKNILIVAPGDGIIQQWIDAGKDHFDVPITPLKSTKDAGKGVCITTYSNLGQNHALASRDWDLLIMDESHTLSKNEQGNSTSALRQFWGLTVHDNGYQTWFEDTHQDITNARKEARKELDKAQKEKDAAKEKEAQQRYDEADRVYKKAYETSESDYQGKKPPKVVFLSATPFAYIKNLQYAEGFLFEYPKNRNGQKDADQFLMDNFGYQYKNGHLERPGVEVDGSLMGKQFHDQLVQEGALHGRTLEVDADYDRGFIRVNNGIGNKIDEGFTYLAQNSNKYSELNQFIQKKFDYIHKRQLLEAIKAKEAVELVKQYVKSGKKVVVFHDYNEGGGMNPFNLTEEYVRKELSGQKNLWLANRVVRQLEEFKKERPDLLELDLNELKSPIETFQNAFNAEEVGFYNGQNKKTRITEKDDFNDDNGKKKILVVQSNAGEAGISLHDTTGKYQRVLINLGMPTRPTATIQIEGRIYRVGNKSNAIFRYLNTGTVMEGEMFSKMAERSGMVEAIAMGEKARALQGSINAAYEESQDGDGWKKYLPGSPTEGTGGKAMDYVDDQLSTYDKAKAFYFATQKKTSRNKSAEGTDYYATPEPLGLKMVEWADPKSGENMMEPSAGHGAIARWMPDYTRNTVVEPSRELQPKLQRNVSNANVIGDVFESLDLHNKFGSIVMNPPFGTGGKTAIEHLAKAFRHLSDGGRVVAIIPDGTSTQKRFDKWFYGDENGKTKAERDGVTNGVLRATINLPAVTFERADTKARTRVLIIDRYDSRTMREAAAADVEELTIDAKSINELFDQIEELDMPSRIVADERQYSISQKTDEELRRSVDELKAEIKEAFPGAKNVEEGLNSLRFEMPNGAKITVDMRNQIVATQEELDRAKQEHGYNANDNIVVEGFAETHGKEAYIALSQGSRKGTGFHEAFHVVRDMTLTDKEKAALDKYYKGDEEKQADAYAAWVEARRNGHGTLFGKLWCKVQDMAKQIQSVFTGVENVHNVFRKMERGNVWSRENGESEKNAAAQLKEDIAHFSQAVDDFIVGKLPKKGDITVMTTPMVMHLAGAKVLPIHIDYSIMDKIIGATHVHAHGKEIPPSLLKKLPSALTDPLMIIKSDRPDKMIVVVDLKDKNGATVIVPMILDVNDKKNTMSINKIMSVYGKGTPIPNNGWIAKHINNNDLLYINKKRTARWMNNSSVAPNGQLASDSFNLSSIIPDETDLGKLKKDNPTKYSIRIANELQDTIQKQDQKIADDARKKFESRIEVAEKAKNPDSIGLHRTWLQSPSRIAEKKAHFRPFFKMADRAMNTLTRLRADYARHLETALKIDKKDKQTLSDLLWQGDAEGVEYSRDELKAAGYNDAVIDSYWRIRNLMRKAYRMLNDARRQAKTKSGHFAGKKLEDLRNNKFVEILKEEEQKDGSTLVTYKEYGNWTNEYNVSESEFEALEHDNAIQILEKVPTERGQGLEKRYKVTVREGIPDIHDRKGYIPHFFHQYLVRYVDSKGNAMVVGSGRNIKEATEQAIQYQKDNPDKFSDTYKNKIIIAPKVFDFTQLGMDESQYGAIVGDKEYYRMIQNIAEKQGMTLDEAKELLKGSAKQKGRHRFFGNFLQRKGAKGYEQDMEWVLRHYFNSASRYVAMETEFKPRAISLFERLYGRYDNEYSGLPHYIKEYIADINGNPSTLEKQLNELITALPFFGKWVNVRYGDRPAVQMANFVTNKMSIAKLGFFNVSSAMLNIFQLANTAAYTGNVSTLWKALGKGAHFKYSMKDLKVLRDTNVLNDIGLDSGAGYGKFSAGKWANRSMILFKTSEGIVRRGTVLAAFDAAKARGMSYDEAIKYAKEVNRKANFEYGVQDAPNIFRRGSIFAQLMLQFKKYPIKQLEVMKDMTPFLGKTTSKKQKAVFWGTYFAMAGLFQIPFANIVGLMVLGLTGDDPEKEAKKYILQFANEHPDLKWLCKIALYGVGSGVNVDVSSRVGMGDAIPDRWSSMLGPTASTFWNVAKSMYAGDAWEKQIRNISPGLGNLILAAEGRSIGKRGRTNAEYTSAYQRLLRGMGFNSTEESDAWIVQSILSNERSGKQTEKQALIDEYLQNPTTENAMRLKKAGIKPATVKAERKKKALDARRRLESGLSKKEQKEYQYLLNW